ncbi:MAG: hypothetical protein QM594_20120 [Niabella sp.]
MKKRFLQIVSWIIATLLSLPTMAQTQYVGPSVLPSWTTQQCHQWVKRYGAWNHERLSAMQPTAEGGFIMAGQSSSSSNSLLWIVKTDANGNEEWNNSYTRAYYSEARSIQQTADGGYIVAGYTGSQNSSKDFWILKTDAGGTLQWQKTFGGSNDDEAYYIYPTKENGIFNGYIVAGTTSSDDGDVTGGAEGWYNYWVVKLDINGNLVWQKKLEASQRPYSIKQTNDGGYIIAGDSPTYFNQTANPNDPYDEAAFNVIKLNASGDFQWQLSLGTYRLDAAYDIIQTSDGNYLAAGYITSINSTLDLDWNGLVVKIGPSGNILWYREVDYTISDEIKSIRETADGGFAFCGITIYPWNDSYGTYDPSDFWLGKLDASGQLVWQSAWGNQNENEAIAIAPAADGGYAIAGTVLVASNPDLGISANLDYLLLKLEPGCTIQQVSGHYKVTKTVIACCGHGSVASAPAQSRSVIASTANNTAATPVVFTDSLNRWIASVTSGGSNPVGGDVEATVWVDMNQSPLYVRRHYEITPENDAATATGTITLYFSQEDFDGYNQLVDASKKLPASPNDAAGKANFRIVKYSGVSTGQDGLPGAYTGGSTVIDPDDNDIVWNSSRQIWEISFDVTGFSGFFATDVITAGGVLPVTFGAIYAYIKDGLLTVNWTTETETSNAYYMIEISADGKNFTAISDKILSRAEDGNSSTALQYSFTKSYALLQGMAIAFFILMIGFGRNNRKIAACMAVIGCFALALSCKKSNTDIESSTDKKLFIRIAQVDKDGTKRYSKIIAVNNEQ